MAKVEAAASVPVSNSVLVVSCEGALTRATVASEPGRGRSWGTVPRDVPGSPHGIFIAPRRSARPAGVGAVHPVRGQLVAIVVAVLLSSGLGIITPFLTQAAFDRALFPADGVVRTCSCWCWLVAGHDRRAGGDAR